MQTLVYATLDEIPEALRAALAAHGALSWIGFDPAVIFFAFGRPLPSQPADHMRVMVHLRLDQQSLQTPPAFIIDTGSFPLPHDIGGVYDALLCFYNQLPELERSTLRQSYYPTESLKHLVYALVMKGIYVPMQHARRVEN